MNSKLLLGLASVSLGLLALTGCTQGAPPGAGPSPAETSAEAPAEATLTTGESSLGTIVVDGAGLTVYVFDNDVAGSGESSCEGDCLVAWPPVVAASDSPAVDGVTGTVGTITRTDGTEQVTLNGLPLYYYEDDAAAGDVTGQGAGGVWWVIDPGGEKITDAAAY